MGSFLSDTFFKSFSRTVNMFISIFMIQILQQLNFKWYRQKLYLLANRKKITKFLMRIFSCRSTFLYVANLWLRVSASAEMFEQAGEARARAHTFHVDSGSELDTWLVHPSKQSTCTQHRHSYHHRYHRIVTSQWKKFRKEKSSTRDSCTPRNSPPARNTVLSSPLSSYILSQANGKNSRKKSARKKIAGWRLGLKQKCLCLLFAILRRFEIFAFSYVVSS